MKNDCRGGGCKFCSKTNKNWTDGQEDYIKYHMTEKIYKAIKITIEKLEKI